MSKKQLQHLIMHVIFKTKIKYLHCYMRQNIKMSTYCSSQTFYTTTNFYFFINAQFCLKMRTILLPSAIIITAPQQLLHNSSTKLLVHVRKSVCLEKCLVRYRQKPSMEPSRHIFCFLFLSPK